jgi:DHA1 family bicyclomycin/chloramphenicol resistance-like MFS transporter
MAVADAVASPAASRIGLRIAFLGLINAMAAFSTDPYLPALPRVVSDLHTTAAAGQISLTTFLLGLALGQLVIGGICDARGRRTPMLLGAVGYVLAAVACTLAPTIGLLFTFRFVQGVAAAAGVVGARAMVRDLVAGPKAAAMFSRLFLVAGVMPVLAPLFGAGLEKLGGWRTIFVAMAVLGTLVAFGTAALPETLPPQHRRTAGVRAVLADWGILTRDRNYVALVLTLALTVSAMFGYLSSAAFVLKDRFGLDPTQFALAFGFGSMGFIGGNLIGTRISGRGGAGRAAAVGCLCLLVSVAGLCAVEATGAPLGVFLLPVLLLFISTGMIVPNTMTLAVMPHPERAGSAAALMGVSQFVVPGLLAPIIGAVGAGGWALPGYEVAVSVGAAVCFFVIRGRRPAA